jgi:hypothetical protein
MTLADIAKTSANDPKRSSRGTATFTNGRRSDVDGPICHAKRDRRTHTRGVLHTRAVLHTRVVPHRPDIHQPPLAAITLNTEEETPTFDVSDEVLEIAAGATREQVNFTLGSCTGLSECPG